jgi:RimJ/RimL family protein N-acetyltransferase
LALAELANDFDVWINLRDYFPHPYTYDHAMNFIHQCQQDSYLRNCAILKNQRLCGVIGIIPGEDIYRHTAEIGYWLGKPYWGMGIATSALMHFSEYLFTNYQFMKLEANVFAWNPSSMNVLQKAGYQHEATLKHRILKNNQLTDEHRFVKFNPKLRL